MAREGSVRFKEVEMREWMDVEMYLKDAHPHQAMENVSAKACDRALSHPTGGCSSRHSDGV